MVRTRSRGAHASGQRAPMRVTRARGARTGDRRVREQRVSRVLSRSARVRVGAIAGAVVLLAVALALGGGSPDVSVEPTVQSFLLNWENAHYRAAAAQTTGNRVKVAAALAALDKQLDADDLSLGLGPIRQHGDAATAGFKATVNLGFNGEAWTYQGHFALRKLAAGWKVLWNPSVVVPGLRPGLRLAVLSTVPARAALLDSAGKPLTRPSLTYIAGVYPGKLTSEAATANRLARVTGIDPRQLLSQIQVAPAGRFLKLVRLSPGDYRSISGKLSRVPGLIIRTARLRLFDSIAAPVTGSIGTEMSSAVREAGIPYRPGTTVGLSGLQEAFQRTLVGTPTTAVVTENRAGKVVSVLQRWVGKKGMPVRTTINATVQQAADRAVASLPTSATIVAVRPANGQILAVANHTGRRMPVLEPLAGHYQPGQAFTIVSTAALLARGVELKTPIPCPPATLVGGQNFVNQLPEPDLGAQPPFQAVFAHACRSAIAGLSLRLNPKQLTSTASIFGLGASWQLPLSGAFAGTMRPPTGTAEVAADSVGNGSVLASPLQMALIAALVASGSWHAPSLVTSQSDPAQARRYSLQTHVGQDLRTLMRATVASGAGRPARVGGQAIYGQVGTAPLGSATSGKWASWFVGFRGGVAFAVLEVTTAPSNAAAGLAGQFLRGYPAGS
jgi:cell division protein FtsI/penicillin-binding protein 2